MQAITNQPLARLEGMALLLLLATLWGSSYAFIKLGVATIPPVSLIAARTAIAGVLSGTAPFGVLIGQMVKAGLTTDVIINALEQKGLARSLAEPNLVALSGDTASFLAGGEFPVPVPGALGQVSIEYKRYGVGLAFTPTVISDGLLNLKLSTEVSDVDPTRSVTINVGAATIGAAPCRARSCARRSR